MLISNEEAVSILIENDVVKEYLKSHYSEDEIIKIIGNDDFYIKTFLIDLILDNVIIMKGEGYEIKTV